MYLTAKALEHTIPRCQFLTLISDNYRMIRGDKLLQVALRVAHEVAGPDITATQTQKSPAVRAFLRVAVLENTATRTATSATQLSVQ